jgi:regulator of protease activity HflC (stomatin/prohibitin superfamily)
MRSFPTGQSQEMSKNLLGITGLAVGGIVILSSVFVVPAGQVGVVTTLGKVSKTPRLPGLNIKLPFIQSSHLFSVRTQVVPEKFSTLTKDLQVIEATATVKFAVKPNEAPRIYSTISSSDASIYGRVIQPSLLNTTKADAAYVSEYVFIDTFYKAHAKCANVDLNFLNEFRWCLNRELEDIYIDSRDI